MTARTRSARRSNPQRMSVASLAIQIRAPCARSIACRLGSPITTPPPVLTENSVHISCGTLIVDLVKLATVTTIVLDLGDREPLRRTVDECFHAQGVRGAQEFGFGSTEFGRLDQREAALSATGRQRRCNWLAPAM